MLPVFLVTLPAGALADMVDRRRYLLVTQSLDGCLRGTARNLHPSRSCSLLGSSCCSHFILGLGAVVNDPGWQSITPDVVCRENHAAAVALNSAGFNLARAVGPALGGMVIAATSSGVAFLINAASLFRRHLVFLRWKRPPFEQAETGRVLESLRAGFRLPRSDATRALCSGAHWSFQPGCQRFARAPAADCAQ